MSRRKQRSAFDQLSEFDRGRIVAYQECGLSFREIGSRVGRNQTTVMRICDRWMFFVSHQIELFPWLARSPDLSPIENMWSMVAQRLTQITPPLATPDQLWQRMEAAWSVVPKEHIQSHFESMPRGVAALISNNGGYSGY
ncbi:transposable element Tcb1 transposase [Trichonephila clavipes]|nr:transposable element Tcb1 transposase [Trichonephila clavipes]